VDQALQVDPVVVVIPDAVGAKQRPPPVAGPQSTRICWPGVQVMPDSRGAASRMDRNRPVVFTARMLARMNRAWRRRLARAATSGKVCDEGRVQVTGERAGGESPVQFRGLGAGESDVSGGQADGQVRPAAHAHDRDFVAAAGQHPGDRQLSGGAALFGGHRLQDRGFLQLPREVAGLGPGEAGPAVAGRQRAGDGAAEQALPEHAVGHDPAGSRAR
jgi:hypothetical protein